MDISLIIAPHPDDETLGCGATISKMTECGNDVYVAILTNAYVGAKELFSESDITQVRREALKAHEVLGVKNTLFYDLPAPRLDQHPLYKISDIISHFIKEIKPTTLYIPHRGDLHIDHKMIYDAALVAARPQNKCSVKKILAYETLSETEWASPYQESYFIPNYFIEVSDKQLEKKKQAMSCYRSQVREYPHSRSIETIEILSRYRGSIIGVNSAEAYSLVRMID